MTGQEMKEAFLLQYDINGSAAVAGFLDEEIYDFLNKAQMDIIKKVYTEGGAEAIQDVIDNQYGELEQITGYPNANAYRLVVGTEHIPDDFLFYVSSRTYLTRSKYPELSTATWVENDIIELKEVNKFVPGGSNEMLFYNPVSFISSDNVSVIIDSYTNIEDDANNYNFIMSYVRKPYAPISDTYDAELNEKWHQEIVDLAVRNAMFVTNDVRMRNAQQAKEQTKTQ